MKLEQFAVPAIPNRNTRAETNSSDPQKSDATKGTSFGDLLEKSVEKVNSLQKQADAAIDDLVIGNNKDIVQTMIMMEKADVSFRLMMQIRNKIIQAYEEVMRMQV